MSNNADGITSPVFETRREAWRSIVVANLNPFAKVHVDQIDDAANELADGLHTCARAALAAQMER